MTRLLAVIGFVVSLVSASSAQIITPGSSDKCPGKIYAATNVTRRARLIDFKSLTVPKEASDNAVSGQVIINAILCRNGRVTDIVVVKGLPFGVTESAVNAVRNTRFAPAELNFHSVSQQMLFQFSVNEFGASARESTNAAGRIIEEVDVVGNQRLTKEEIFERIKSRPGEVYQPDQVQRDFASLIGSGYFNSLNSRVNVEGAVRGGVRIIFEVKELPLIAQIAVQGYKGDATPILNELPRQHIDVGIGRPLDAANLKKATRAIEDHFRRQGWSNIKVEALVEYLMVSEVKITFRISGSNF
jgi:TonB family protein